MEKPTCVSPLGTVVRGFLAGAIGAGIQSLFFRASRPLTPPTPKEAFLPPEELQNHEGSVETVARRAVEQMMARGPLAAKQKQRAGVLVHFAFGAGWGTQYALARESVPMLNSPRGMALFSSVVWATSDNLILPAFRLSAWPRSYPLKNHLYAWAAHIIYGLGVWSSYEAMRMLAIKRATASPHGENQEQETEMETGSVLELDLVAVPAGRPRLRVI